jgi:hypothetical protein
VLTAKRLIVSDRTLCLSLHIPRMRWVERWRSARVGSWVPRECVYAGLCWFKTVGNAMRSRGVVEPDAHRARYAAEYASHSWRWCTQ